MDRARQIAAHVRGQHIDVQVLDRDAVQVSKNGASAR